MSFQATDDQAVKDNFQLGLHWPTQDPFLFCAFHKDDYPKANANLGPDAALSGRQLGMDFQGRDGFRMYHGEVVPGFPEHPHRGFETVTMVNQGYVDHADSLGAAGRYGQGDVQWMTAGRGIQHSEMFPLLDPAKPNPLVLFQIWLNLPSARKMVEPHFKMLWQESIPEFVEDGLKVRVVAGRYGSVQAPAPAPDSWAAEPQNHVAIWEIHLNPGAKWVLPAGEANLSRALYYFEGDGLSLGGRNLGALTGCFLDAAHSISLENGAGISKLLFLQGRPIKEPVVQSGPFVMNSREEISEAILEYRQTQFGGWPWDRSDVTHGSEIKRFARYPDGKEEVPT